MTHGHANGESCINGRCVCRRREEHKSKGEGKRKVRERKKEKKRKEREREKKGKEKEGEKEISVFFLSLLAFRRSELVELSSKVCIFYEDYAPRVGILPILVYFYPLDYCFGLVLGPCCAMFMA